MPKRYEVLVVGGGVVGLSTALAMAMRGFHVALIDAGSLQVTLSDSDPRVYAVNRASQTLFEHLGVWPLIDAQRISPYRHMHVWDAESQACIDFDARLIARSELGFIIEESVIRQALLSRLKTMPVDCFPGNAIRRLNSTDETITVSSEDKTWQGRLLMAADGALSPIRDLLQVPLTSLPYHQQALVASVGTEKPHQATAWQVFNPDGPLAFLPLTNPYQCSIVWSTTRARATNLSTCPTELFQKELERAFSGKLGQVTLNSERYTFPLTMRHTQRYVGSNWMLLGDAAHTIHPLAGLGLNVGLADVSAWLACLKASPNGQWTKRILATWQRQRKHAVWQIIALMGGLKTLFASPLPPVIALRGLGLNGCNQLTLLKRFLIEQAEGDERF